jgi:hypothetical protein
MPSKERYWADREKWLAKGRIWEQAHPEKAKKKRKRYYDANREKCLARTRAWKKANREACKIWRQGYRQTHAEQIKVYDQKYRSANKKKHRDRAKTRREANLVHYRTKDREYYWADQEKSAARKRAWRQANPDKCKAIQNTYKATHREQISARHSTYNKTKRKAYLEANPHIRLMRSYGKSLARRLKGKNAEKSTNTVVFLGCSIQWLKIWLEKQFQEGMNWENYGSGWHVDHIRPCASFDLTDPEQQRQCFHWLNLQPLWARENRAKSDKWSKRLCL